MRFFLDSMEPRTCVIDRKRLLLARRHIYDFVFTLQKECRLSVIAGWIGSRAEALW